MSCIVRKRHLHEKIPAFRRGWHYNITVCCSVSRAFCVYCSAGRAQFGGVMGWIKSQQKLVRFAKKQLSHSSFSIAAFTAPRSFRGPSYRRVSAATECAACGGDAQRVEQPFFLPSSSALAQASKTVSRSLKSSASSLHGRQSSSASLQTQGGLLLLVGVEAHVILGHGVEEVQLLGDLAQDLAAGAAGLPEATSIDEVWTALSIGARQRQNSSGTGGGYTRR